MLVFVVSIIVIIPHRATSKPIQVRAKTALKASVTQDESYILITADLVDDAGTPVKDAPVRVELSSKSHLAGITGQDGKVTWSLDASALSDGHLETHTIRVHMAYEGSEALSGTTAEYTYALHKDDIQLNAAVSPSRLVDGMHAEILLSARKGGTPLANVPLHVSVADYNAVVRTGGDGRAQVRSLPILEPGSYTVEILFKGSLGLRRKVVTRPLVVAVQPSFDNLDLKSGDDVPRLYVAGQIMDGKRRPLSGVLRLTSNEKIVDQYEVLEGTLDGSFDLAEHAKRYGDYDGEGRLEFLPTKSWVSPAEYGPFNLRVPAPSRPSVLWYGLMMMIFVLLTLRPVFSRVRRGGYLRTRGNAEPVMMQPPVHPTRELAPTMELNSSNMVRLVCVSALVPSSKVKCAITLTYLDGSSDVTQTDADGWLVVAPTQPVVSVQAAAPGFIPQRVSLPSRGLSDCTLYLVPHRAEIRAVFEQAISKVAPSWRFGTDSVSDLISDVPAASIGGAIDSLSRRFEQLYYNGDHNVDIGDIEEFRNAMHKATEDAKA